MENNKSYTVYAAGGWFTELQEEVQTKIEEYLMSVENLSVYRPRHDGVKLNANEFHDPELRKKVFHDNVYNIDEADFVVANLDGQDGFLDTGTIWEVGYAMAKGIPVIGYQDEGGKMLELIPGIYKGFVKVCTGLQELNDVVSEIDKYCDESRNIYLKGKTPDKVLFVAPDNTEEHKSKATSVASIMMECFGANNLRWVHQLSNESLALQINDVFKDVSVMVAVIDDRHPVVSWMMGQAYARNVNIVSYTDYDYGVNLMLAVSVKTHIKGTDELKSQLHHIKREGIDSLGEFDTSSLRVY